MRFDELKLNEAVVKRLSAAVNGGRLSHAVILEGGSAEDRYSAAMTLANALVCSGEGVKPCGKCGDCIKCGAESHPDVFVVKGDNEQKSYPVDLIRTVRNDAYIMPNEAEHKVYVLMNADLMSEYAQNALLKILEEPPEYVRFILTCGSKAPLLSTVISRATVFLLGAEEASGDDELTVKAKDIADRLAEGILAPGELAVMQVISELEKDKALFSACLPELRRILCDALAIKKGGRPYNETLIESRLGSHVSAEKLIKMLNDIQDISDSMKRNANYNLQLTRLGMKLR
ncbi:MAG: hypothetical protein K5756_06895 [Clostridiales bacterium]|nr:hypothetical protein [Clostridiales bacterium]